MKRQLKVFLAALVIFPIQSVNASDNDNRAAPACVVKSMSDAKVYDLQQLKGKVVYVDFWASWCAPCVQSFPFMNSLNLEFKEKGLQILAINMDENMGDAQSFLAKYPAKFPVLTDANQQCAKAFEVKAMPSSYLIDRNGVIRHQHLGFRAGEAEMLQPLIKQLLAEPSASR